MSGISIVQSFKDEYTFFSKQVTGVDFIVETSFIITGRKLLSFIVHGKLRDSQIRSVAILFTFYEIYNSG